MFSALRRKKKIAASNAIREPLATVNVSIASVAGLPKMDQHAFGRCDPFVVVRLGEEERRTKTVYRTYQANYNTAFEIPLFEPRADLIIEVWDADTVLNKVATATASGATNERVGSIAIPLSVVVDLRGDETTYQLLTCDERPSDAPSECHVRATDVDGTVIAAVTTASGGLGGIGNIVAGDYGIYDDSDVTAAGGGDDDGRASGASGGGSGTAQTLGEITLSVAWGTTLPLALRGGGGFHLAPGEELLIPGGIAAGWLPLGAVDDDGFVIGTYTIFVQLLRADTEASAIVVSDLARAQQEEANETPPETRVSTPLGSDGSRDCADVAVATVGVDPDTADAADPTQRVLKLSRLNPNKHTARDVQLAAAEAACRSLQAVSTFYLVDERGAVFGAWVDRLSGRPLLPPLSVAATKSSSSTIPCHDRALERIARRGTALAESKEQVTLAEGGTVSGTTVFQQLPNRR